jgi:hypothetical protein
MGGTLWWRRVDNVLTGMNKKNQVTIADDEIVSL